MRADGSIPVDTAAQFDIAMDACLREAGGKPEHVVKVQVFMTDISERAAINPRRIDLRSGLRPGPLLTVSEWADQHRRLSGKAASEPGPWRTSRTPYLREIMDCLSPASSIELVVVMKGVQFGISECCNNRIGYVIHHAPGPMLAVLPTVEMAKRNSKQRIDQLIQESEVLSHT